MPKIAYITREKGFNEKSLTLIELANGIIEDYASQGFDLTLRQLYYQMVARDIIPNHQRSYDNLGNLINQARLEGYIDWDAIKDITRSMRSNTHWTSPQQILNAAMQGYRLDSRADQEFYIEVWVEKDALINIIDSVCRPLDIPYFACRGYTSQSEMWAAAQRLQEHIVIHEQKPVILHLGDHDPSGIDMSRDIEDRLNMFIEHDLDEQDNWPYWYTSIFFNRLALNYDQIRLYNPPPNPAKFTDSRAASYIAEHGTSSWELDALSPTQIAEIIRRAVAAYTEQHKRDAILRQQKEDRDKLTVVVTRWNELTKDLVSEGDEEEESDDDGHDEYDD
jgi:hypothetical protein